MISHCVGGCVGSTHKSSLTDTLSNTHSATLPAPLHSVPPCALSLPPYNPLPPQTDSLSESVSLSPWVREVIVPNFFWTTFFILAKMRGWSVLMVLVAVLAVTSAAVKKPTKKASTDDNKKHITEIEEKLEHLMEQEAELESEIAEAEEEEESSNEENEAVEEYEQPQEYIEEEEQPQIDPCGEIYCGAGRMCVVNDLGEGECRCVNTCDSEDDPRRRVCSNMNETWMSDCELYRQRCLCEDGDDSCKDTEYAHSHIDYFGECQAMPVCEEDELEDFPRRLSEWLFNIMRDLADRQTLSEHYVRLERAAEEDTSKQWTYAVVWKWCELDSHPKDKSVSRHELFPMRAPLFTLEHCIGSFLDSCDGNNDHNITLQEWATCTKLSEDQVDQLEELCEDIRNE
ncbi:hypothetical protein Pcinc_030436 [Petrolisthes cinctipes]|uniref:SPARC/Testican calcium-binding domain-containing protein n=1 Tax=Petrolisthes cinctipes TaxID=88211 RepID=A0AAE1EYF4_PETCI|nr:hypothetical protein Pcinc_030436 [Petrolisthes cinctipes]